MPQNPNATVRGVAEKAGVSPMTVTRALRGDGCVSAAMRSRVERAAAALGYRVNPAASSLMSSIRHRRVASYRGKLAWLNTEHAPPSVTEPSWVRPLHDGVRDRAEQSGYLLDQVWLNDPQLNPHELTDLLIARGIQGLILTGFHPYLGHIQWDRFACAATQFWTNLPPVHLACSDYVHGARESFAQLQNLGYRRIGLLLHKIQDQEKRNMHRSAFLLEQCDLDRRNRIPVLLISAVDEPDPTRVFGRWVRQYKPDAVMCYDEFVLDWARKLGIDVPGELGLAHLNRHAYLTQWSGIDQREDQIGAAAVDLVAGQLARNELGLPPYQKEVLIKGRWVTGATVKQKSGRSGRLN